jgi:flagellar basal body-associated protein FliL
MKTVWKWILGIVIVLIVVAALVGGFVMMRNYRMTTFAQRYQQFSQRVPNGTPAPKAPNGQSTPNVPANPSTPNRPMMGRGFGFGRGPMTMGRGPMMMGHGYNQFGRSRSSGSSGMMGFMVLGLVGLIVLLAVLAGVAFVFYKLGKSAGISSVLLAQQASNAVAATDTDPPARAGRARKTA